jgi:hypothetical protein
MAAARYGIGLSSVTTTSMAIDVPEQTRATTSGIVNTSAQLGTAIGTALLLLLAEATTGVPGRTTGTPVIAWRVITTGPQRGGRIRQVAPRRVMKARTAHLDDHLRPALQHADVCLADRRRGERHRVDLDRPVGAQFLDQNCLDRRPTLGRCGVLQPSHSSW